MIARRTASLRTIVWALGALSSAGCVPGDGSADTDGGTATTGGGTTAGSTGAASGGTGGGAGAPVVVDEATWIGPVSAVLADGRPAVLYGYLSGVPDEPVRVRYARAAGPDGGGPWELRDVGPQGVAGGVRATVVDGRPAVAFRYVLDLQASLSYGVAADPDGLGDWSVQAVASLTDGAPTFWLDLGVVGGRPTICWGIDGVLRVARADTPADGSGTWEHAEVPMPADLSGTIADDCAVWDLGGRPGVAFAASDNGGSSTRGLYLAVPDGPDLAGSWSTQTLVPGVPDHVPYPMAGGRRDGLPSVLFFDQTDFVLRATTAADPAGSGPWTTEVVVPATPLATPASALALSDGPPAPFAAYAGEHPTEALYGVFAVRRDAGQWGSPIPVDVASNTSEAPLPVGSASVIALPEGLGVGIAYDAGEPASGTRQVRFARIP